MSIVLENRVEAVAKSTEALNEELLKEHRRAMFCYDVEDLVGSVVALVHDLNAAVERWQADAAAFGADRRDAMGAEFHKLYCRVAVICPDAARFIRTVEDEGRQVRGKSEFLQAWRELRGIACFSIESVTSTIAQIHQRKTRLLGEVKNELWQERN